VAREGRDDGKIDGPSRTHVVEVGFVAFGAAEEPEGVEEVGDVFDFGAVDGLVGGALEIACGFDERCAKKHTCPYYEAVQ